MTPPLPTTATTAKQTAAKAAKTRAANQAEQETRYIPLDAYAKLTPAILPNLPDSQISEELLQHFHDLGMTSDEIKAVAGQWLITQAELAQFNAKQNQATQAELDRIELQTAKLAAQMEACILQRGQVTTKAILIATPDRLLEFIDYYEAELDDLYPTLTEFDPGTMSPQRLEAMDQWDRLNRYLWECKQQAGTGPVTLQVLTNQNLNDELQRINRHPMKPRKEARTP